MTTVHYVVEKHLLNDGTLCGKTSRSAASGTTFWPLVTCPACLAARQPEGEGNGS